MRCFAFVVVALSSVALAQAQEQRRLELLGTMSRQQQLAPANQSWLVSYVRRASSLYQHRLDGLACRELFSLGSEQAFHAAVGCAGDERNCVFIEGSGSPKHLDQGPFIFPADTFRAYWPPEPARNTYWHEVQHALLESAGVSVTPGPYAAAMDSRTDTDDHHAFIEGVGQRGAEAYFELLAFEAAARRADQLESEYLAQGRDPSDHGVQRQLWSEAHQRFSAFTRAMKRVANMPPQDLANYRGATGVWFSPAEDVAEWYRRGGLKRQERGEALPLRPPGWVFFPDLMLMPVRIMLADARGQDLEGPGAMANAPSELKDDVFRQAFVVRLRGRGSLARWQEGNQQHNRAVMGAVSRGRLRVRLVEDDPLASLSIAGATGVAVPGGTSSRLYDVDANTLPLRVTLARRKLSSLTTPTTLHVVFEFTDPGADRVYDSSSAQLSVPLTPGAPGDAPAPAPSTGPTTAPPPGGPAQASAPKTPVGVRVSWSALPADVTAHPGSMYDKDPPSLGSTGTLELISGPSMFFKKGEWRGEGGFFVEVYAKRLEKNLATVADYTEQVRPKGSSRAAEDWFGRFTHRETTVGGLRAFESVMTGKLQRNHHWFVELDAQRQLWATILCDVKVKQSNADAMDGLAADLEAVVRALRFSGAPPPVKSALSLTRAEGPVPRAFSEEPLSPNELSQRPPPPPPDPAGRRRKRVAAAPSTTQPPGAAGEGATTSPPPSAPPARGTEAPPPPPSGVTASAPPRGGLPPPPAPATAGPRGASPAAAEPLVVRARVAMGTSLILSNMSPLRWTACTVVVPGQRVLQIKGMPPNGSEEYPLRRFSVDGSAPALRGELLVRCAEGEGRTPIRL